MKIFKGFEDRDEEARCSDTTHCRYHMPYKSQNATVKFSYTLRRFVRRKIA